MWIRKEPKRCLVIKNTNLEIICMRDELNR